MNLVPLFSLAVAVLQPIVFSSVMEQEPGTPIAHLVKETKRWGIRRNYVVVLDNPRRPDRRLGVWKDHERRRLWALARYSDRSLRRSHRRVASASIWLL